MPHVILKIATGKTETQKKELAADITRDIMARMDLEEDAISIAIQEIPEMEWMEMVYNKDILAQWDTLYKKPGYGEVPPEKR